MKVHHAFQDSFHFNRAVVTIGTFDGVHKGHRQIIEQMLQVARRIEGETVLITFDPHPRNVLHAGQKAVSLLNTVGEKASLLEALGLDHLVVVPFTETFAKMTAMEYVESFLLHQFHPHTIIIGYDHRFGADRSGNYELLEQYRDQGHFQLEEIPMQVVNENRVSSTHIRTALQNGLLQEANQSLGYPYFLEGRVIQGDQRGRTLGYPTANIEIDDAHKLLPHHGVYAATIKLHGLNILFPAQATDCYQGMLNCGIRPTTGSHKIVTEVHLFHFSGDLYGQRLRVFLHRYIRPEQRFAHWDALRNQLDQDAETVTQYLSKGISYTF